MHTPLMKWAISIRDQAGASESDELHWLHEANTLTSRMQLLQSIRSAISAIYHMIDELSISKPQLPGAYSKS